MRKSAVILFGTIGMLFTLYVAANTAAQTSIPGTQPGFDRPGAADRGQGFGRFQHRSRLRNFFMNELGLSEEQKQRLRELRSASRERTKEARSAIRNIREQKLSMLKSGKINPQELLRLDKEFIKHHTQLDLERLKMQRDRAALLTPEQAKRLGEFLSQMRDEMQERRRARRGSGRGFPTK